MTEQVLRQQHGDWVDAASVHAYLSQRHENLIWLDAGPNASTGYSYIAIASGELLTGTTLEPLRSRIPAPTGVAGEGGPFQLGYIGWLAYELGARTTDVALPAGEHPALCFAQVRAALEFDHERSAVTVVSNTSEDADVLVEALGQATQTTVAATDEQPRSAQPVSRHTDAQYREMVQACRDAIYRGDAYQLCLTNELVVDGQWNPAEVYTRLRHDNPSHHGALLSLGGVHLLSSSPEVFLRLTPQGKLSTMPIKGTRARGITPEADRMLVAQLLESTKEQAENLMIVDLMRNDLSRVGVLGTVAAENLLEVHTLPHVHQLVSTVSTQLRDGLSAVDAIEATFPAGSMTGAPKIAAMGILAGLEKGPRGIYSGAFGWIGNDGACELAMVIRSIVIDGQRASIGTGGGITIGSDPQAELDEMKLKAAPALRALGLA